MTFSFSRPRYAPRRASLRPVSTRWKIAWRSPPFLVPASTSRLTKRESKPAISEISDTQNDAVDLSISSIKNGHIVVSGAVNGIPFDVVVGGYDAIAVTSITIGLANGNNTINVSPLTGTNLLFGPPTVSIGVGNGDNIINVVDNPDTLVTVGGGDNNIDIVGNQNTYDDVYVDGNGDNNIVAIGNSNLVDVVGNGNNNIAAVALGSATSNVVNVTGNGNNAILTTGNNSQVNLTGNGDNLVLNAGNNDSVALKGTGNNLILNDGANSITDIYPVSIGDNLVIGPVYDVPPTTGGGGGGGGTPPPA